MATKPMTLPYDRDSVVVIDENGNEVLPDWLYDQEEAAPPPAPVYNPWGVAGIYGGRRASAPEIEETAPKHPLVALVAGAGTRLALAYGYCALPAKVTAFGIKPDGTPVAQLTWCMGEVGSVVAVYAGSEEVDAADVTNYLGADAQATIDPDLAAAIDGYTDTLPGVCYSSVKMNLEGGVKRYMAIVEGRECYNPSTTTTGFTRNPAYQFMDAATLAGLQVDEASIIAAGAACNELLNGIKRNQCNIYFDQGHSVDEILTTLAEYAGCFYIREGGVVKLVPDRPTAVSMAFSDNPLETTKVQVKEGTVKVRKTSRAQAPNRVISTWTDISSWPWKVRSAATPVPVGEETRETTFAMVGHHTFEQSNRHSIERLNAFNLCDLETSFEAFDDALALEVGDVFTLESVIGLIDKPFRCTNVSQGGDVGHWFIEGKEYQPNQYSDDISTAPAIPDTEGVTPETIPAPVNDPAATEKLFVEEGGKTLSRLEITWQGDSWRFVKAYRVEVLDGVTPILDVIVAHQGSGTDHHAVTPAVAQGVQYTVNLYLVNLFLTPGTTATSDTVTAQGKLLKPSAPGPIHTGYEVGLFVYLAWGEAQDIDLAGYRVKRIDLTNHQSSPSTAWDNVNAIEVAHRWDGTSIALAAQPVGSYVYMVKAIDSIGVDGQESTSWVEKQVEVTLDQAGAIGIGEVDSDAAQDSNVHTFTIPGSDVGGGKYIASTDGATWAERFGAAGTFWTANAQAGDTWHEDMTNASSMESLTWDTGEDRQGNWVWSLDVTPINSPTLAYTTRIAKSATPASFTDFAGQSAHAEGRYLRCKLANTSTAAGAGFVAKMTIQTSYQGVILYDVQTVAITAGQMPYTHTWSEPFSAAPEVSTQVVNGVPRLVARDSTTKDDCVIECWAIVAGSAVYADTTLEISARGT